MAERIPRNVVLSITVVSLAVLIGLLWCRVFWIPNLEFLFFVEVGIASASIVFEVGGIGLLLDWFQERRRQQRYANQREILLDYLYQFLFTLSKVVGRTKSIQEAINDIDQRVEEIRSRLDDPRLHHLVTPELREFVIKLSQHDKEEFITVQSSGQIFLAARFVESVMNRVSVLVVQLSDLFTPNFVSALIELTQRGYAFSDKIQGVEHGFLLGEKVGEVAEKHKSEMTKFLGLLSKGGAKLFLFLELWDFAEERGALQKQCLQIIQELIVPRASPLLKEKIESELAEASSASS